jgi:hypothetical protein
MKLKSRYKLNQDITKVSDHMATIDLNCPQLGSLCPVSRVDLILDAFCPEFTKIIAKIILLHFISYDENLFHRECSFFNN